MTCDSSGVICTVLEMESKEEVEFTGISISSYVGEVWSMIKIF